MSTIALKEAQLANGLTLPYAEAGYPGGMPVVFVHAVGESWRSFEPVLGVLPPSLHGFAPTQRGHGDAGKPESGYRPEDYAADLVAFLDATGIERAVLVGGSSGGVAARIVAGAHPDRVAGLALVGTPATLAGKDETAGFVTAVSGLPDTPDRADVEPFFQGLVSTPLPQEFHEAMLADAAKAPGRVWRDTVRGLLEGDMAATLGGILVPTVLIWGDQDAFLTRQEQESMRDAIFGAELKVLEGLGHVPHWQDPARVLDELVEFTGTLKPRL